MKGLANTLGVAVIVVGAVCFDTALAQDTKLLPPEQRQGDVVFVTGGIGSDEADVLKKIAWAYPLELEFVQHATPRAEFLADVKVVIKDARGKTILDTRSEGPYLLARLPPGTYSITAETDEGLKRHTVAVTAKGHQRVVFEWR
jgi:hypothetical protein